MKHDKIFASASFVKFLDIYVSYCYVLAHPSSHGFAFATVCTLCTRVHGHGIYIYIYIMVLNLVQSPFVFVLVQASHFLLLYLAVTCYFCTADSDQFQ